MQKIAHSWAQCICVDFILFVTPFNIAGHCRHRHRELNTLSVQCAQHWRAAGQKSKWEKNQRKDYCYCYHLPSLVYSFYFCVKMKTQMWGKRKKKNKYKNRHRIWIRTITRMSPPRTAKQPTLMARTRCQTATKQNSKKAKTNRETNRRARAKQLTFYP